MGWTETACKSNRQGAYKCMATQNCVFYGSKIISKKIPSRLLFRLNPAKKINIKTFKKLMFVLIAGSIIGPAMAGPTGPFATALN